MSADLNSQLITAATALEESLIELDRVTRGWADADKAWRQDRARAYVQSTGTVNEREAVVELATGDLRYAAQLAEGLKVSALEAVRSRRAILSAVQSMAALSKAEAEFSRTGPRLSA